MGGESTIEWERRREIKRESAMRYFPSVSSKNAFVAKKNNNKKQEMGTKRANIKHVVLKIIFHTP